MKLQSIFISILGAAALVTAVPAANPEAEPLPGMAEDLEKRACTSLTSAQCHASSSTTRSGVYCGLCPQVQGSYWSSHPYYAYQLNAATKSCCTYGTRLSCLTDGTSQCPI